MKPSIVLLPLCLALTPLLAADESPTDLLGTSLSHWEIFMGAPHSTVAGLPEGTPMSEDGMKGTPLGLNNDPKKVFSVISEDGGLVLKISGEIYGGLTTRKNHANYLFETEFKWGERKWEPRMNKKRDSGILYHCHGEHGQWNKLQLYVLGDSAIHVVNGLVVLSVADARDKQCAPVTSGQIQIQSEAVECYYRKMRISPIERFPKDLAEKAGLSITGGIAPGQAKP